MGRRSDSHYNKLRQKFSSGKEGFEERSKSVHGDLYEYSKVDYINNKTKVIITCKTHGDFIQRPDNHINLKQGCPVCKKELQSNRQFKTTDLFISEARNVHKDRYDYSLSEYKGHIEQVKIICREHGVFSQRADCHLSGSEGCKKCSTRGVSKSEKELYDFVSTIVRCEENRRKPLDGYELDIYIPSINKAIEFNGEYWHYDYSNDRCKPKGYHGMKSNLCRSKGINLLHIREDLWLNKKDKMKETIIKFLNFNT